MNGPEVFLAAVALGALCTFCYVLGAARCEARRRRADWRCRQLIALNEQLRQEREALNAFLSVVTPEEWSA